MICRDLSIIIILGDKCRELVPQIQTGQGGGTISWSLRLDFLMKMGSLHEGTWSPGLKSRGLVARIIYSPFVCADLKYTVYMGRP